MKSAGEHTGKIHRLDGPHPQLDKHAQDHYLNVDVQTDITSGPGLIH